MRKIGSKLTLAILVLALISIVSLGLLSNSMTSVTALAENMKGIVEALDQVSDVVSHLSEQTACFES